jgi:hypothetical protein
MTPISKGGQELKPKPTNVIKIGSWTPKKFLVCCYVVIKVQKWFVEFQMVFL